MWAYSDSSVCQSVRPFVQSLSFRVRSIKLTCMDGFPKTLGMDFCQLETMCRVQDLKSMSHVKVKLTNYKCPYFVSSQ